MPRSKQSRVRMQMYQQTFQRENSDKHKIVCTVGQVGMLCLGVLVQTESCLSSTQYLSDALNSSLCSLIACSHRSRVDSVASHFFAYTSRINNVSCFWVVTLKDLERSCTLVERRALTTGENSGNPGKVNVPARQRS